MIMITATVLISSSAPPAHAYLDPGTGSILIQGLLAAIAGAAMTLKIYWGRIVQIFSRRNEQADEPAPDQVSDNS